MQTFIFKRYMTTNFYVSGIYVSMWLTIAKLSKISKRISFQEYNQWKLTPAYDLIFAYDPNSYWLKNHNININGKNNNITQEDILKIGEKFGIKKANCILQNISEITRNFKFYADKYQYPVSKLTEIDAILQRRLQ